MSAQNDYPLFIKKSFLVSPSLLKAELIGSFTQVISYLLLVLLLSVYVNLFKELFIFLLSSNKAMKSYLETREIFILALF